MKKLLLIAFCISAGLTAQEYFRKPGQAPYSFKDMQYNFELWKQSHDLKKERGWKNFKRWEQDMTTHTDANGELVENKVYMDAVLRAWNEKQDLMRSASLAPNWYPVGPANVPLNNVGYMTNGIGRVNCIAFHPKQANTLFIGVAQGGVWKTTNYGNSWTPLTDNLPITRVSDICIDKKRPDTMYVSLCDFAYIGVALNTDNRKRQTHYGLGVYKTTDGGQNWSPTGLSFNMTSGDASLIKKILVDTANPSVVVAAGASGFYRSTNGGTTFTQVLDSMIWDLVQDPVNPQVLYAAGGYVKNTNKGYAAIYKSTNFGQSWSLLATGIPPTNQVQRIKLAIAPNDNNYIYAIAVDMNRGLYGIYKSTNAGTSWNFLPGSVNILEWDDGTAAGGQGTYDLALMVHPQNKNVLYSGGINMWASSDGAQSWEPVSHWTTQYGPSIHADIHYIDYNPHNNDVFVCHDGGVDYTSNVVSQDWSMANGGNPWPTSWTSISDGMAVTSFYRISSSRNNTGRLVAGAQDNASFYYDGTQWSTVYGGDGMDNWMDPLDDNNAICSAQFGSFGITNDNGLSFGWCDPNVNGENGEWTTPIVADYSNPGVLYCGYKNVTKSTDNGQSWNAISNFSGNNEITAIAVSKTNANVIYAAKRVRFLPFVGGSLHATTNGGSNWTNVTSGLPDSLYITSVEVDENNSATAYVSVGGFKNGVKVFKTTNNGSNWTNISYNLPNLPVNCIKYVPGSGGMIIAATDVGVYTLNNGATSWINQSLGLPNVIVSDIEFNQALGKIYISTFGRSIWAADINTINAIPSVANLNNSVKLYPTLNNGLFSLEIPYESPTAKVQIIDVMGRVVYQQNGLHQLRNEFNIKLNSGAYYLKADLKNGSVVKQFIVE